MSWQTGSSLQLAPNGRGRRVLPLPAGTGRPHRTVSPQARIEPARSAQPNRFLALPWVLVQEVGPNTVMQE